MPHLILFALVIGNAVLLQKPQMFSTILLLMFSFKRAESNFCPPFPFFFCILFVGTSLVLRERPLRSSLEASRNAVASSLEASRNAGLAPSFPLPLPLLLPLADVE